MNTLRFYTFLVVALASQNLTFAAAYANDQVRYKSEVVEGIEIFYRESGDPTRQAVVLLHGFPSSSHQYRAVLADLGDEFYVVAPDYPGFGYSAKPTIEEYTYTFDNIATTMTKFLDQRQIRNYFLMIHDYGSPVGFRIATENPEDVDGLIVHERQRLYGRLE